MLPKPQAGGPVAIWDGEPRRASIDHGETFAFLDCNATRDVPLAWKEAIHRTGTAKILPCELRDLEQSWDYFRRADLHKLSAVDATYFAIMKRARIRRAFAFDHHFAAVGFKLVA